ncbi:MAG: MAPEG family protein [Myxococcota bacterium]
MPLPISALYLAIFAVFAAVLSFFPGRIRGSEGISIGDGGRPDLLLAMRRHANFVEFVPYFMLMFAALELNGASAGFLHGIGLAMVVARICHAIGLKADTIQSPLRGIGAGVTFLVTLIAAGMLGYQFVGA